MSVATIMEAPKSPADLAPWSFAHAAHHTDINRALFSASGVTISAFVLDPFDPKNMEVWLAQHQVMHDAQNAALGIAGFNLNNVDWEQTEDRATWFRQHGQEHYEAGRILGVG